LEEVLKIVPIAIGIEFDYYLKFVF